MMEKERKKKKKRPLHKSKMITGYIIYASEIRKDVIKKYPDRDFGDISKLVGIEWKNLLKETKIAYEKRAREQNVKSKEIAAEALEIKKLADAAEERTKEQAIAQQTVSQQLPTTCNGYIANGHSQPVTVNPVYTTQLEQQQSNHSNNQHHPSMSNPSIQQQQSQQQQLQQQPLQIIQQQHQPIVTTVQYCSNDNSSPYQQPLHPSHSPPQQTPIKYQRNNIVYRKPATVRLRPKDATTQTELINWVKNEPKKPLRFSQKFIDYLNSNRSNEYCL